MRSLFMPDTVWNAGNVSVNTHTASALMELIISCKLWKLFDFFK